MQGSAGHGAVKRAPSQPPSPSTEQLLHTASPSPIGSPLANRVPSPVLGHSSSALSSMPVRSMHRPSKSASVALLGLSGDDIASLPVRARPGTPKRTPVQSSKKTKKSKKKDLSRTKSATPRMFGTAKRSSKSMRPVTLQRPGSRYSMRASTPRSKAAASVHPPQFGPN